MNEKKLIKIAHIKAGKYSNMFNIWNPDIIKALKDGYMKGYKEALKDFKGENLPRIKQNA